MPAMTTITLFRYTGLSNQFWALSQMGLAPGRLKQVPGQTFFKMLGTGRSGFSTRPDWGVYALLQTWHNEGDATHFLDSHPIMCTFRERASEHLTLFMRPLRSHGKWDGRNPFVASPTGASTGLVAVLTRATIRKRYLYRFWKYVPSAQRPLVSMPGLLYSKGVGETPFIDMATFSLWENAEAMESYAYGTDAHKVAIRKTRELGWYREELFARFLPYRAVGSWAGIPDLGLFREGPDSKGQGL